MHRCKILQMQLLIWKHKNFEKMDDRHMVSQIWRLKYQMWKASSSHEPSTKILWSIPNICCPDLLIEVSFLKFWLIFAKNNVKG